MLRIGCCGFGVAKEKYYRNFSVVEIQQTFYQPPMPNTAQRWRLLAPADFEFTLKAWQLITHPPSSPTYRRLKLKIKNEKLKNYGFFKPTEETFHAWDQTEAIAKILKAKVIVFQCPPSFVPSLENKNNLKKFFRRIERKEYSFVWETRGNWPKEDIVKLCRELNLSHCVDPFKDKFLYGQVRYFRLHGKTGYRYRYTEQDLELLKKSYPEIAHARPM
jgi:uncharacterized protein YecE (DUF72 family)